jgi:hypothetical protein
MFRTGEATFLRHHKWKRKPSKITQQRWENEETEPDYVHHWSLESRLLWKGIEFFRPVLRQINSWVSLSY